MVWASMTSSYGSVGAMPICEPWSRSEFLKTVGTALTAAVFGSWQSTTLVWSSSVTDQNTESLVSTIVVGVVPFVEVVVGVNGATFG